jgi:hypothetical protein
VISKYGCLVGRSQRIARAVQNLKMLARSFFAAKGVKAAFEHRPRNRFDAGFPGLRQKLSNSFSRIKSLFNRVEAART